MKMGIKDEVEYLAKYDWYKMTEGMYALSVEADKEHHARSEAVSDFCAKVGSTVYATKGEIAGFVFKDGAPEGWRKSGRLQGTDYFYPRKSGATLALYNELRALKLPSSLGFSKHYCGGPFGMTPTSEDSPRGGRISRAATYTDIEDGRLFGWPNTSIKEPVGITLDELESVPLSVIIQDMERNP